MIHNKLLAAITQTKIQRARQMSLDARLAAGARLDAEQIDLARDLISGLHPDWSEGQVDDEMKRRQGFSRDRESRQFYRAAEATPAKSVGAS